MTATNIDKKLKRKRIWHSIVTTLAAIVVFVTTYALIIPAITWEKTLICPLEEHAHSEGCYNSVGKLVCGKEEHNHIDSCFDAPKTIEKLYICGKTEHSHTEDCFFENGTLKCTIPEHNHTWKCRNEKRTFYISTVCSNGVVVSLMGEADSLPYPASEVTLKAEPVKDARVDSILEQSDYFGGDSLVMDITLWHGAEEIQPTGEVSLIFAGIDGADENNTQVLHVEPEKSEINEMDSYTEDGIVSIETEHFSIYVVSIPVHTYEFYVDGELVAKQIVKSGDELLRPETPNKENYKFLGWSWDSSFGVPYFNDFGVQSTVETGATKLYADLSEIYYVFFMQPNEEIDSYKVFATKEGIAGTVIDTTDIHFKVSDSQEQVAWRLGQVGAMDDVESVTIEDRNITLFPRIENVHWLTFDTQTEDSYVKPVYYLESARTAAPTPPTRAGYTFRYWSTEPDGSAYSFGGTLSSSITLYAVWQPQQVNYTVIHWIENANYWDETDRTAGVMQPDVIDPEEYSFWCVETKSGTSGMNTNATAFSNAAKAVDPATFDTNHWTAQPITQVEIDGHGNTIVNVYYKRTVKTIYFQIATHVHGDADALDGGKQIYDVNGNPFTIKAKWGATVSQLWPDQRSEQFDFVIKGSDITRSNDRVKLYMNNAGAVNDSIHNSQKRYQGVSSDIFQPGSMWCIYNDPVEDWGWFECVIGAMPDEDAEYYYLGEQPKFEINYDFMVEPIPGETNDGTWKQFNGKWYKMKVHDPMWSDHPDWWTTQEVEYEGFTYINNIKESMAMFVKGLWGNWGNDSTPAVNAGYIYWTFDGVSQKVIRNNNDLANINTGSETAIFLYSRNKYDIHFISEGVEINTIEDIYYEYDISDTSYTPPERDGYTFEGWYSNEALAGDPYSFEGKIMPAKDITLYAKWIPNTVTVRFFDDVEDPELISEQTYDIGDVIDPERVPDISRDDEKFIYWMAENETGELEPFNMSTYLDADVDLYPYFVPNGKFAVTYDLNDANAIEIIGEAVTGNPPADTHEGGYAYGSYAEIELLPGNLTIPEGLVFLHWNTEADDSGTDFNPQEKLFIDHDYTLYAIWGPDPEYQTTYLTYHANRSKADTDTVVTDAIPINDQILIDANTFEYPGHTFVGWNTEPDGNGDWWEVGTEARLDGDGEENNLYAIWEICGEELPATGGVGTTTIYAISALLMLGALTIGHILWRRREGRGEV